MFGIMLLKFFVCSVSVIGLVNAALLKSNPIVVTSNGAVQGIEQTSVGSGLPFYSFKGIPYAEPPINNLRFEPPVAKSNWDGVLDATTDGPMCIQGSGLSVEGSEDCLHLNVYTPTQPSDSCTPLPVFVWIFGGGFEGGNNSYELYGPDNIVDKGAVVVTVNYRLGLMGFMSTADLVVPGNNGLKDQSLALRWVRDNIASFCGDPNQVTLGGQSSGAVSVAYHIQSPMSAGLFQRGYLSSGTSLNLWGYCRRGLQVVQALAGNLSIDTSSSTQTMVNALRTIPANVLQAAADAIKTSVYVANNPREGFAIGPVSEVDHPGAFFSGRSHELLRTGQFNKVPILIGFNSMEGSYDLSLAFRLYISQFDLDNRRLIPIDMNVAWYAAITAGMRIKSYYFGLTPISLSNIEIPTFLSDDQFIRAIREFARLLQNYVQVHFYRFSYEGGLWGITNRTIPGVTHSEELGYYWVSDFPPIREQDLVVKERWTTLLTNYIKYGDPTPTSDPVLQNTLWNDFSSELNYLDVGENLVMAQQPQKDNMLWWDKFYARYGNPPYGTY